MAGGLRLGHCHAIFAVTFLVLSPPSSQQSRDERSSSLNETYLGLHSRQNFLLITRLYMVSLRKRDQSDTGSPTVEPGVSGESVPKTDVAAADLDEVAKAGSSKSMSPAVATSSQSSTGRKKRQFCSCKGEDDGRPMIRCDGACNDW